MNENYRKAISYVYIAHPAFHRDLIHDAYIRWFDKTGKNLFEEHFNTIKAVLIHVIQAARYNKFMYRGIEYPKVFIPVVEVNEFGQSSIKRTNAEYTPVDYRLLPDEVIIGNQLLTRVNELLIESERDIVNKLLSGHTYIEIFSKGGRSPALASYYGIKTKALIKKKLTKILSEP